MRLRVSEDFRQSMGWLHTWSGIALASVLFAIFWTGTLTVFDREIDQWMKPELRIPALGNISLDETALPRLAALEVKQGSVVWVGLPRERIPAVRLFYDDVNGTSHEEWLDPRSGEVLDLTDSDAGSEFLFHFHYMLHVPGVLGYYLVGVAALGMMALVVSGIFIHRKIVQDFFTFRPQKQTRRAVLDFHNLTAVIGLPFHFIIPFSGLLILVTAWFPWSMGVPFDGDVRQLDAALLAYERPRIAPAGEAGEGIDSLDLYVARANAMWRAQEGEGTSQPDWIALFNMHDAESYVVVERFFTNRRVALGPDQIVFNPRSGDVIDQFKPLPIHAASSWIEGLHWIQFDHWPLRWLYFFAGLSGCAMIGAGLVCWIQARIRKMQSDPIRVRIVRAITIGSVTGIILASAGFLLANKVIPKNFVLDGVPRHELEIQVFFLVWILAFVHALIRDKRAWCEQSIAIAVTAGVAVALNWITTGDHPITAAGKSLWAIVIMDIVVLSGAAFAIWAAIRLRNSRHLDANSTTQGTGFSPHEEFAE